MQPISTKQTQVQVRVNDFIRSVYNWMAIGLALTGLVLVLILCGGIYGLSGPLRRRSRAAREADAQASAALHEALAGIDTVRTAGQEPRDARPCARRP